MNVTRKLRLRARAVGGLCGLSAVFQFGGCDLGSVTTTTTFDGREALIQLIRGALLTPIDAAITAAVNEVFGTDPG